MESDDKAVSKPSSEKVKRKSSVTASTALKNKKTKSLKLKIKGTQLESTGKRKLEVDKKKRPELKKKCVNPECPRKSDKFQESPRFVLAFYYAKHKKGKQFACNDCFEQAVATFELMGEALLNNSSIDDVKIPQKLDIIEIEDSDEEELEPKVPNKNKILFDKKFEETIESILESFSKKIDLPKQVQRIEDSFTSRMNQIERETLLVREELFQLERSATKIYNELYAFNKRKILRVPSIDADAMTVGPSRHSRSTETEEENLSKPEFIDIAFDPTTKPEITRFATNEQFYYAIRVRSDGKRHWAACRLLEWRADKRTYEVEFFDEVGKENKVAEVSGKELALSFINEKLKVGTRVIARFFTTARSGQVKGRFLPGVVGEKLCAYNGHRYLIFCDYGQVQYAKAEDVRQMAETSENVWEDVHPNLQQFIKEYLQNKNEGKRRLLNVRVKQIVPTEHKRQWHVDAVVREVDASLVKIHFPQDNSDQWMYRGSRR